MSWDVLVLNYHGSPPADMDEMAEAGDPDPLGKSATVRKAISKHLPGVDWSTPRFGIYWDEELSIEFDMGKDDPVTSIMLLVQGSGDAVAAMLQFAIPNNWSLFDCSSSEFINPEAPSQAGWEGFQEYRDKVLKRVMKKTPKKPKRRKTSKNSKGKKTTKKPKRKKS